METKSRSSSEYKLNEVFLIQFSLRPVQGIAVHPVLSYFMAFCLCHNTAYNIQANQIKDCACTLTVIDGLFYPDLKALQFEIKDCSEARLPMLSSSCPVLITENYLQ